MITIKILAYIAANKVAFIVIAGLLAFIVFRFAAPKAYEKVDDVIAAVVKIFCAVMLTAMIFVCFYNTTARYLFNASTMWAEESIRYAAVWVTCVGASMTARADNHTTMDLIQELIKNNKARAIAYAFTRFISCLVLVLLIPAAFKMLQVYSHAFSPGIVIGGKKLPMNWLYFSFLFGCLTMVLGYLRIVPPKFMKLWTGTMEKTEFELINEGLIGDDEEEVKAEEAKAEEEVKVEEVKAEAETAEEQKGEDA